MYKLSTNQNQRYLLWRFDWFSGIRNSLCLL